MINNNSFLPYPDYQDQILILGDLLKQKIEEKKKLKIEIETIRMDIEDLEEAVIELKNVNVHAEITHKGRDEEVRIIFYMSYMSLRKMFFYGSWSFNHLIMLLKVLFFRFLKPVWCFNSFDFLNPRDYLAYYSVGLIVFSFILFYQHHFWPD